MTQPTVVCVDDEPRILNSLNMLLKKDYQVRTMTQGEEAIAYLKTNRVNVILSDQRMPKMTGVEVLQQASVVSPNTVRILLTGYSDLSAVIGSINDGEIYRFINKPWSNEQLRAIVQRASAIADGLWLDTTMSSPSVPEQPPALVPSLATTRSPSSTEESAAILVLDESEQTLRHIKSLPGFAYRQLFGAKNLDAALTLLDQHPIGVVVTDLQCGQDNILEFINLLKQEYPLIVTIVITKLMDFSAIVSLINDGRIFRYLPKPVTTKSLEVALILALKRHQRCVANPTLLEQFSAATQATLELRRNAVPTQSQQKTVPAAKSMGNRLRDLLGFWRSKT